MPNNLAVSSFLHDLHDQTGKGHAHHAMAMARQKARMMVTSSSLRQILCFARSPGSHWFMAMRVGYTIGGRLSAR